MMFLDPRFGVSSIFLILLIAGYVVMNWLNAAAVANRSPVRKSEDQDEDADWSKIS